MYHNEFITHQRLSAIKKVVIPEGEVDDPLAHEPPKLVNYDWEDGKLTLYLDREVNHEWVGGLNNMGGHSNMMGFPPESFVFRGKEANPSGAVQPGQVQGIIDHFKPWLPAATRAMKQRLETRLRQDQAIT